MGTRSTAATVILGGLLLAATGCGSAGGPSSGAVKPAAGERSSSAAGGQTPSAATPSTPSTPSGSGGAGHARSTKGDRHAAHSSSDAASTDPAADEDAQPTKDGRQTAVLARLPGKPSAGCLAVGRARDIRSGSFAAGPFDTARSAYGHRQPGHPKRNVRLYFIPLHGGKMPGLTLRFENKSTGASVVTRQKQTADAEQWRFYDTETVLPSGGTWTVRASAGADAGCFVFTLPSS